MEAITIKEKRVYVCGPMTHIPQFNFPAFDAASADLRARGYKVMSPAEMDDPETRRLALASVDGAPGSASSKDETWGDFLARDVKVVADTVDAVVVLPGWNKSRGGRLETFIAYLCNKPVYYYPNLQKVPFRSLVKAWTGVVIPKKIKTTTWKDAPISHTNRDKSDSLVDIK